MKRVILVLLVAVFVIPTFQSCKKGENDPSISLRSRKARLTGEWKLKEGTSTQTIGGTVTVLTFNGTTVSASTGGSANYTESISIVKDGTFKMTRLYDGDTWVIEGQWYFMEGNKDNEIKDKEVVAFYETSVTYNEAGGVAPQVSTYVGITPDFTWQLDELKNKEIIVKTNTSSTSGGGTNTEVGTKTYVQ